MEAPAEEPAYRRQPHVLLLGYERLGVMVLRRAWVNMDAIWAVAVVAAGVVTLFT